MIVKSLTFGAQIFFTSLCSLVSHLRTNTSLKLECCRDFAFFSIDVCSNSLRKVTNSRLATVLFTPGWEMAFTVAFSSLVWSFPSLWVLTSVQVEFMATKTALTQEASSFFSSTPRKTTTDVVCSALVFLVSMTSVTTSFRILRADTQVRAWAVATLA